MIWPVLDFKALFRAPVPHISENVQRDADRHREGFLHAQPFKHLVIENFFEPSFAERLEAEFPLFNADVARTENPTHVRRHLVFRFGIGGGQHTRERHQQQCS
jgi:hypothetical protein